MSPRSISAVQRSAAQRSVGPAKANGNNVKVPGIACPARVWTRAGGEGVERGVSPKKLAVWIENKMPLSMGAGTGSAWDGERNVGK